MQNSATLLTSCLAALVLAGCTADKSSDVASASATANADDVSGADMDILAAMLSGKSATSGSQLEKAIEQASAHPLGSAKNPVRAHMPPGQRAYLSRLKCADLKTPKFFRVGSMGMSPYGNIVDGYEVTCPGSAPAKTLIHIDMYHSGYAEDRAVEGFGITGGVSAPSQ